MSIEFFSESEDDSEEIANAMSERMHELVNRTDGEVCP
jgi:hypothetical protein